MAESGMTRREVLAGLGSAAVGAAVGRQAGADTRQDAGAEAHAAQGTAQRGKARGGKPNILWITAEGTPNAVLSCYGSRLAETPHIDRIAKEGMRFTNGFVTNALCAPSRATLLTGTYTHVNGMIANPSDTTNGVDTHATFSEEQETVAKIMKREGYQTGVVGKWHLPANPGKVGFDYYVYKDNAGGPYYQASGYKRNQKLGSADTVEVSIPGYITDNVVDLTMEAIDQFTEPFFMMVQFFNDHRPFDPPHKYGHIYDGVRIPEPGTFWDDYADRAAPAREARMRIADMPDFDPPAELTDRQRQQWNYQKFMEHFLGTLRAQDDAVGRLLDYLDKKRLAEDTIVVYTADHGFFLGDHGWFDKRFMYEQAIRVPWMIRWPGHVKAGAVSDGWVVNIDNAPTVLDLAGIAVPAEMQGKSIRPLLKGDVPAGWPKSYYYHYYEFAPPHWVLPHYGLRTERYTLISYYTVNEWELFDREKDPDEMENLFAWGGYKVHPAYAEVVPGLVSELEGLREKYGDTTGGAVKLWATGSYD